MENSCGLPVESVCAAECCNFVAVTMLPAEARWPPRKQPGSQQLRMWEWKERGISAPYKGPAGAVPTPPLLRSLSPGLVCETWDCKLLFWSGYQSQPGRSLWVPLADETRQSWRAELTQQFHPPPHLIISGLHGSLLLQLSDSPLSWYLYKTSTEDSNVSKPTGQMWWIIVLRGRLPAPQWF